MLVAASVGTVFEWYDFFLYGSLAVFFGQLFFPSGNPSAALLASLATFGAGFAVRPFGALVFGRLGDLVGRKYTFLLTITVMGVSTALVGLMPTYDQIGIWAPILLVLLRLAQGLAIGGEYGGAAIYVAEHAPKSARGFQTSWIQTTATLGFLLSLLVILACRLALSPRDFEEWGWRLPFLLSVVLLAISIYVRMRLKETPLFQTLRQKGKLSRSPVREAFTTWANLKWVLVALFGATAAQSVVWYTGQFYAFYFLLDTLRVDFQNASILMGAALLLGSPLFLVAGALSDRIGRKPVILAGALLMALTVFPVFQGLTEAVNPRLAEATRTKPVTVIAPAGQCSLRVLAAPGSDCDWVRDFLSRAGVGYDLRFDPAVPHVQVLIGQVRVTRLDEIGLGSFLAQSGYPTRADPAEIDRPRAIALLTLLIAYVALVYGPIAALLVELFPTRIRYSAVSLPYHIGNGWFGGFLPVVAFALVVQTGNPYAGLWYPVLVAVASALIGLALLPETRQRDL